MATINTNKYPIRIKDIKDVKHKCDVFIIKTFDGEILRCYQDEHPDDYNILYAAIRIDNYLMFNKALKFYCDNL